MREQASQVMTKCCQLDASCIICLKISGPICKSVLNSAICMWAKATQCELLAVQGQAAFSSAVLKVKLCKVLCNVATRQQTAPHPASQALTIPARSCSSIVCPSSRATALRSCTCRTHARLTLNGIVHNRSSCRLQSLTVILPSASTSKS